VSFLLETRPANGVPLERMILEVFVYGFNKELNTLSAQGLLQTQCNIQCSAQCSSAVYNTEHSNAVAFLIILAKAIHLLGGLATCKLLWKGFNEFYVGDTASKRGTLEASSLGSFCL